MHTVNIDLVINDLNLENRPYYAKVVTAFHVVLFKCACFRLGKDDLPPPMNSSSACLRFCRLGLMTVHLQPSDFECVLQKKHTSKTLLVPKFFLAK